MPAKYSPVKPFDAKQVYDVWIALVGDEEMYDAMLVGKHREVAARRGMNDEEILILDDFASQPGTRWHMDNLRFRCTTMVSRIFKWHLPATIALLTGGNEDWIRDITYEYMSDHNWRDLGHHRRFAECARFAKVVGTKFKKRRLSTQYLDEVLKFELAVLDLLREAAHLPPEAWSTPAPGAAVRPKVSEASKLVELPVDIVDWLAKPEGKPVAAATTPTTALVWIPAPSQAHRIARLDGDAKKLFEMCRGEKTIDELAAGSAAAKASLEQWLRDGALVA